MKMVQGLANNLGMLWGLSETSETINQAFTHPQLVLRLGHIDHCLKSSHKKPLNEVYVLASNIFEVPGGGVMQSKRNHS